jgi:hypothetical protein
MWYDGQNSHGVWRAEHIFIRHILFSVDVRWNSDAWFFETANNLI